MIKPEFWTSEQVLNCSRDARLLFIGLWNFADDQGIHPASFIRLKAENFPADDFSINEVKKLISELIQQGLLREYTVDEKSFWLITGWQTHQKIEKPRSIHPLPESDLKLLPYADSSAIIQRAIGDDSATNRRLVDTEKKGKEVKRKEKDLRGVETPAVCIPDYSSHDACTQIFEHWQKTMNHPQAKLDDKRKRVIVKALELGFDVSQLKLAISGCKNTPFNMGKNDRNQVYDDITLVLRDAGHIERFMSNAIRNETQSSCMSSDDIMAGVI